MQNFYGQYIRNNVGDKEKMVNDIWAFFKHMIIEDGKTLEEQNSVVARRMRTHGVSFGRTKRINVQT